MATIEQAPAPTSAPEHSLKLFGMKIPLPDPAPQVACQAAATRRVVEVTPNYYSQKTLQIVPRISNLQDEEEGDGSNAESGSGHEEEEEEQVQRKRRRKQEKKVVVSEKKAASAATAAVLSGGGSSPSQNKKPQQPVACPRCQSMDTKFCYFNNYNINQPRHFCKSCQRYWTAGGTLRNVPVGAGRRKSKHAAAAAAAAAVAAAAARVQDSWRRNGGAVAAAAAAAARRSSSPMSGMSDDDESEDCSSSSITQESKAWVGGFDPAVAAAAALIGGNWTGLVNPWNAGMLVSPLAARRAATPQGNGSLWVPKSQRIEGCSEAGGGGAAAGAAASFLNSLASAGTNKVAEGSIVAGGMFKAFQGCNNKVQEEGVEVQVAAADEEEEERTRTTDSEEV